MARVLYTYFSERGILVLAWKAQQQYSCCKRWKIELKSIRQCQIVKKSMYRIKCLTRVYISWLPMSEIVSEMSRNPDSLTLVKENHL